MKIKTTKTMNLPQLIEHIVETSYECNKYIADNAKSSVYVGSIKGVVVEGTIFPTDTFTVEVEEEITEDTPLSMIIECDEDSTFWVFENTTLKNIHQSNCEINTTKYYRDEDENMHIIWRNGKLVE